MREIPCFQVDAFTSKAFQGNPAAVCLLETPAPDLWMQQVAAEMNLAETAFLVPDESDEADYELRWFTPTVEIALCGHATLASGHYLLTRDPALEQVRFRTRKAGILTVTREGEGYALALPAYPAGPADIPGLLEALGVSHGTVLHHPKGYDLTVLESAEAVRASMGALFTVGLAQARWDEFLPWLRSGPGQLVAASLRDAVPYRGAPYAAPCFILVGNESQGLPEAYEAACDLRVTMPMKGRADSLNAAIAGAVLAYEVLAALE